MGLVCFSFSSFASIDTSNQSREISNNKSSFTYSNNYTQKDSTFQVTPLQLNRSASMITSFYTLPKNVLLTLEQSFLTLQNTNNTKIKASVISRKDGEEQLAETSWFNISKSFYIPSGSVETYVGATNNDNEKNYSSAGAKIKASISSKIGIEGRVEVDNFFSQTLQANIKSFYKFDTSTKSMLEIAFQYAGKRQNSDLKDFDSKNASRSTIFSPKQSNISTFNISLACLAIEKTFMSVEYFYYLQNKIQVQSFTDESSYLGNMFTNGNNRFLGQELNFKAVRTCSTNLKSELFAGWFDLGEAYSNPEDNKTFEIRGEIIVNF